MDAHLNIPEPSTLLADPAALRQAWAALVADNAHLHGPEAAQRLGVPEAAMIAARIGHGATELVPDLAAVLAPCGEWGKVLLAARNRLGVALMVMDAPVVMPGQTTLGLRTPQHLGRVAIQGVDRCFLFEERDHHGHTVSLNWFDGAGHAIGRLFLMSKSGREVAMPRLMGLALPDQAPLWRPGDAPLPAVVTLADEGATCVEVPTCTGFAETPSARALAEEAVLALSRSDVATVTMHGRGMAVRYQGPLLKTMRTPGAVHASDSACKLHLRMGSVSRVEKQETGDGVALVVDDGDGGQLSLRAGHTPTQAAEWLHSIENA